MKHALAISTYVPQGADPAVRMRLPECIRSLALSSYPSPVVIVDDGSTDAAHCSYLDTAVRRQLPTIVDVIRHPENAGICRAKNSGIDALLDLQVDIGFLADDDVEFTRPGWWLPYVEAHERTGIQHFSWGNGDEHQMRKTPREVAGYKFVQTNWLSGPFLTFTPLVIETTGRYPQLPAKTGHTHSVWTRRIIADGLAPCYCDVVDSNDYIRLNKFAGSSPTSNATKRRNAKKNRRFLRNP